MKGIVRLTSFGEEYRSKSMKSTTPLFAGYRFPRDIIAHAVWLYHRFNLNFRDVEDLLAERGITVTYETIRQWCLTFGPEFARSLRKRRGRPSDTWYLDEVFVKIGGELRYLWRAVDQDGEVLNILVQTYRNSRAAKRFFRKLLKGLHYAPRLLVTDKLGSYRVAKQALLPDTRHRTERWQNNRAEVSHQPTRQRERQMRRFKSVGQAQRFLSVHSPINNLFRLGRHLLRAAHHRVFRSRAFHVWNQVTCA